MASYPTLKVFLRALGRKGPAAHLSRIPSPGTESCPDCGNADLATGSSATHLDLGQWFLAIYLMGSAEEGISAVRLKTYLVKTARDVAKRIRQAIESSAGRGKKQYSCRACKYQFNAITGTALCRTHRLSDWLIAVYLMLASPRALPAKQLERLLGVNDRTARRWFGFWAIDRLACKGDSRPT